MAFGFTRQRLEYLIGKGRISEEKPGQIDFEKASKQYEASLNPEKLLAWHAHLALMASARLAEEAPQESNVQKAHIARPADASDDAYPSGNVLSALNSDRARKAKADADMAELKVREQEGLLIPRDEVARAEFAIARKTRDRILNWPSRLATFVSPEVRKVIDDEAQQLVAEIFEDVQRIVGGGAAA